MSRCIVAFSGGVESTAVLQYCKEEGLNPIAIHSIWPQKTYKGSGVQAKTEHPNIPKICERLDVPYIAHVHPDYNDTGDDVWFHSVRHWMLAVMAACCRFPDVTHVFYGGNNGTREFNDDGFDEQPPEKWYSIQSTFDAYQRLPIKRTKEGTNVKIYPILLAWTKLQHWKYIKDDIKPLVISCARPIDGEPCNNCTKCGEFQSVWSRHMKNL